MSTASLSCHRCSPQERISECGEALDQFADESFLSPHPSHENLWLKYREPPAAKDFDVPFAAVLEKALQQHASVNIDRKVLGGTPRIAGTRIPIFMILDALVYHGTLDGVLESYPHLTIDQVKDAVSFAAAVLEHPIDYEASTTA